MPDQLERFRAAVADNRTGPKLATAVAALRKQRYNVDARESLKRVAARLRRRPSARRAAPHEGHPRRTRVRRPEVAPHCGRARPHRRPRGATPSPSTTGSTATSVRARGAARARLTRPDRRLLAMCGIAGFAGSDPRAPRTDAALDRAPRPRRPGHRDRRALLDRDAPPRDRRRRDRRPAALQRRPQPRARVQRRDLQRTPSCGASSKRRGRRFVTDHSDTEVILRGFEEWGHERRRPPHRHVRVRDLRRASAASSSSRATGSASSRCTTSTRPARFAFASELKALFQDAHVRRQPDLDARAPLPAVPPARRRRGHVLRRRQAPAPGAHDARPARRHREDRALLEPGREPGVRVDAAATTTTRRSSPRCGTDVVARHLISDVPVGVPLSGGLDSSGVVSTMARLRAERHRPAHRRPLHVLGAVSRARASTRASTSTRSSGPSAASRTTRTRKLDDFWNEIDEWIWYQEEPTIASAPYAYYCVYRLASRAREGDGERQRRRRAARGLHPVLPRVPQLGARATPLPRGRARDREGLRPLPEVLRRDGPHAHAGPAGRTRVTARELLRAGSAVARAAVRRRSKNLNERLASDVLQYSTPDLLRYEDKNSMAFSIEARVPFLDHEMVEYIFGLPIDQKIKGGWNRAVYRNAMKGRMPEKNRLRRSKIGFTNPDITWMKAKAARSARSSGRASSRAATSTTRRSSCARGTSTSRAGPATG